VTLNGYTRDDVNAWHDADRSIEEGISEVATMTHIGDFMKDEFGIDIGDLTNRISQSMSAYTRYSERLQRLIGMGSDGSRAQVAEGASMVGDGVRADEREAEMARRIALNLGGANAPQAIVDEIRKTIPGFIAEQNGTRTKLMELQAALVDHRNGQPLQDVAGFIKDLRARYDSGLPALATRKNGFQPID
jgi:hypothetical protein